MRGYLLGVTLGLVLVGIAYAVATFPPGPAHYASADPLFRVAVWSEYQSLQHRADWDAAEWRWVAEQGAAINLWGREFRR